jgi:integrase
MATVRKHRRHWCADFRDQHGFRRIERPVGTFENAAREKLAAQALLTKRLAEVSRAQYIPAGQRPMCARVCDGLLASKVNVRATTLRNYRGLIDTYIKPYFGNWSIETVTPADVERFRFEMTQGFPAPVLRSLTERVRAAKPGLSRARARQAASRRGKPGRRTINKALTLLSMIFGYACKHRLIDHNPAEHIERLRDTRPVDEQAIDGNILAPDEIKRLLEAMPDGVYRMIVLTAIFTGMRQGEILGLQWGDLDWASRQIHVRRAWKEGQFSQPKTRNSIRNVDVPAFLIHELKKWKLRCPKSELDMMFPNGAGNPESHTNLLQRGFYPALRRAGLRKIRFHDLRHTHASLMLANGEDIVRVSRLLGHANPTITLNTYSHMLPREHYGSTDRLAQLVFGDSAPPESKPATDQVVVPFPSAADSKR